MRTAYHISIGMRLVKIYTSDGHRLTHHITRLYVSPAEVNLISIPEGSYLCGDGVVASYSMSREMILLLMESDSVLEQYLQVIPGFVIEDKRILSGIDLLYMTMLDGPANKSGTHWHTCTSKETGQSFLMKHDTLQILEHRH